MMKFLNDLKRSRLKVATFFSCLLFIALFMAILTRQSDTASALCIPIGFVLSFYLYGETSNPSIKRHENASE